METPETHSLVSTQDQRSRNRTGYRSTTALLPVQDSQQTLPSDPEPPTCEMTTMKQAKPKPLQRPQNIWSLWWMEILNCLLMIGMLCAIVGVLYPNNGKPLPDLPYHVSINTVVSILSTILKASAALILAEGISHLKWNSFQQYRLLNDLAVFDKASRGPLGCLQLLTALVRRGWQLAPLLAAALTILTLALDPFTQQLVRYYDCRQENMYQKARLPRANTYNEGGPSATIAASVVGVINQGLYNPDPVTAPLFCPSGNCTFDPPFTTLGFCSVCEDISSQLVISKEREKGTVSTHQNSSWVKTTIPSGSYASYDAPTGGIWFSMNSHLNDGTNNASNWVVIIQASLAFPGEPRPRGFHNTSECGTALNNGTWACSGIGGSGAARCKIKPCVKTYKATLEHGHFKEELVRSYQDMAFVTSYNENETLGRFWSAADLRCAGPRAVERLRNESIHINNTDDIIPWNVLANNYDGKASIWTDSTRDTGWPDEYKTSPSNLLQNDSSLPLDILSAECLYSIPEEAVAPIPHFLNRYFTGAVGPDLTSEIDRPPQIVGPPRIRAFYNDSFASFESVSKTFANIAEALTMRVRLRGDQTASGAAREVLNRPALGSVFEQKTCIQVRWPFLAFPAALATLTTAFLVIVVIQSSRDPDTTHSWKSSLLPMVFHGFSLDGHRPETSAGDGGLSELRDMEGVAKKTMAKLKLEE